MRETDRERTGVGAQGATAVSLTNPDGSADALRRSSIGMGSPLPTASQKRRAVLASMACIAIGSHGPDAGMTNESGVITQLGAHNGASTKLPWKPPSVCSVASPQRTCHKREGWGSSACISMQSVRLVPRVFMSRRRTRNGRTHRRRTRGLGGLAARRTAHTSEPIPSAGSCSSSPWIPPTRGSALEALAAAKQRRRPTIRMPAEKGAAGAQAVREGEGARARRREHLRRAPPQ